MARTVSYTGSVAFAAGDNLTTEKKTAAFNLPLPSTSLQRLYTLCIDKPTEDTAGTATVNLYNVVAVDGTNSRDCLHDTFQVSAITGADTYRSFAVKPGWGASSKQVKVGVSFATDSGAITVYYRVLWSND